VNRQKITVVVILGVVALAVITLACVNRRAIADRWPAWLMFSQPPENVGDPASLTVDQSWAANRCRPMAASCGAHSAGSRIRRVYPETLADSETSFVRTTAQLEGRV